MIAFQAGALGGDPMMTSGELPTFYAAEKAQAAIVRDLFPSDRSYSPPTC
jgi:hypothetical protein